MRHGSSTSSKVPGVSSVNFASQVARSAIDECREVVTILHLEESVPPYGNMSERQSSGDRASNLSVCKPSWRTRVEERFARHRTQFCSD